MVTINIIMIELIGWVGKLRLASWWNILLNVLPPISSSSVGAIHDQACVKAVGVRTALVLSSWAIQAHGSCKRK